MPLPASTSKYLFWVLNAFLALAFFMEILAPKAASAWDGTLIVLATVAGIVALARQLPLQNVLLAAVITALAGGLAHGLSSKTSLPLGPIVFKPEAGGQIFGFVPWIIPLLWVIAIFSARGVARLILRPWRKVKNYGFWLIGFTALLAVAFDIALEPFAWHVKHFWLWHPTRLAVTWQGTTLLNFVGWAFVSLLILAFATPSLIRKQPGNRSSADIHPLILWLGALSLFAVGSAVVGLWPAVVVDAGIALVTAIFAVRGAIW